MNLFYGVLNSNFGNGLPDIISVSVGDVYKAALPSGLKLESETLVSPNPDYEENPDNRLTERESILLDTLSKYPKISVQDLEKESGLRNILPVIRTLLDKEALFITEQIKRKYRPKTETYIKLAFRPEEQEKLRPIFEQLTPAKKQLKLLMAYLELSSFMQRGQFKRYAETLCSKEPMYPHLSFQG